MAQKSQTTETKTPANVIQFRAPLSYVIAFRAAAAKRGITIAQAGSEALRYWLDREKAPILPIHPEAQSTKT
jgi:hypothetical protein